jgi:hypothetical protein
MRPIRPQARTQRGEGLVSRSEVLASEAFLLGAAMDLTQDQGGPRRLEGLSEALEALDRGLGCALGRGEIAAGGGDERSSSKGGGVRPHPVKGEGLFLQPADEPLRLAELPEASEGFDEVRHARDDRGLGRMQPLQVAHSRLEVLSRCVEVRQREIEEAEHGAAPGGIEQVVIRLG